MMKKGRIPVALLCFASIALAAPQDAASLVRTAKVGDVATYAVKVDVDLGTTKVTITNKVVEKVTKVDSNGEYTVESDYSDTKAKVAGGTETEMTQPADTIVYKANGDFSKLVGGKIDASMVRLANILAVRLPGKPVKVGDVWFSDVAADSKTGAFASRVEYKMTSREKVGAFDCVTVTAKYRELTGERPATCEETVWLDVATATVVKRDAVMKNVPSSNSNSKQIVNATLSVLRDQPTAAPLPPIKTGG